MKIAKKIVAATVISTAAFGVSSNASAHSGAAIAAIAMGGLIVGSALATGQQVAPAPAPVAYAPAPVHYVPAPVYYTTPVYYRPVPVYYHHDGYRPHHAPAYYR